MDTLRRARTGMLFGVMALGQCVALSAVYWAMGLAERALPLSLIVIPFAAIPLVLSRTRSLFITQLYAQATVLVMLVLLTYFNGGPNYTGAPVWLASLPICCLLSEGKRSAKISLVAVTLTLLLGYCLTKTGFVYPPFNAKVESFSNFFNLSLLTGFIYHVGLLYERETGRMHRAIESQKASLQLVLDNVGQGFLTVDPSGALLGKHSSVLERWFGASDPGVRIWEYLGKDDPAFAATFELCWLPLVEDVMPLELLIEQLPRKLVKDGLHLRIEYRPLLQSAQLTSIVVVISDITELVRAERAQAAQKEFAAVLDTALRDRFGFAQFMEEANEIVAQLATHSDDALRLIHTLKGNCGVLGIVSVAEHCHEMETRLVAAKRLPNSEEIAALRAVWDNLASRVAGVLDVQTHTIAMSREDVRSIREAVRSRAPYPAIDHMLRELTYEPAAHTLDRLAAKARTLAERLNKGEVEVHVQSDPVRLDPKRWRLFWASFIHALRNAIDHGLEEPNEREACGKPRVGQLHLALRAGTESTVIELADDGRGIDWPRVRERASERGLPCDNREQLVQALFEDGVSTRTEVSDVSGRGVGLGALAEATRALGGRIDVESASGRGTQLRIEIPQPRLLSVMPPAA